MGNPYKARVKKKPVEVVESKPVVPVGSIGEILEWVGQDPERAHLALEQEKSEDRPRKTLTFQLEELVNE